MRWPHPTNHLEMRTVCLCPSASKRPDGSFPLGMLFEVLGWNSQDLTAQALHWRGSTSGPLPEPTLGPYNRVLAYFKVNLIYIKIKMTLRW